MFIAIVQIPMTKRPRDAAVGSARKTAATYTALAGKGLLRKYYLNGEPGGGGIYLWESEAAARAWYTPEWEKRMAAAFGAVLTLAAGASIAFAPDGSASLTLAPGKALTLAGDLHASGEVIAGWGSGDQVSLRTHTTTNVQAGGGTSGPPTPGS